MRGKKNNYLDNFYDWMIRKGKKPKKRDIPSEPMSPIGAGGKLRLLRRILVDLGYIGSEEIAPRKFKYSVWPSKGCKRIYNIKPIEIIGWVDKEFPYCNDRKRKQLKSAYVIAAWKFGEYLVYEMKNRHQKPLWSKQQLKQLKEEAYPPPREDYEIEILPLKKIDGLIEFMKKHNLKHYTMTYLSRWLGGMRYQEVVHAMKDLNSGTLRINLDTDNVTIFGKGRGGLQKPRYPTLLPQVKKVLKKYLIYREKLVKELMDPSRKHPLKEEPEYLFFNQYGDKYAENSGHFNNSLRNHAKVWGNIKQKDMNLVSTHKIGRHGFGTYFYPKMPEKLLMQEMGLEDSKMLHRYANISKSQRAYIMKEAALRLNDHVELQPQKQSRLEIIKELIRDLTKEEKIKLIAELI